jgi:hypothetical protein
MTTVEGKLRMARSVYDCLAAQNKIGESGYLPILKREVVYDDLCMKPQINRAATSGLVIVPVAAGASDEAYALTTTAVAPTPQKIRADTNAFIANEKIFDLPLQAHDGPSCLDWEDVYRIDYRLESASDLATFGANGIDFVYTVDGGATETIVNLHDGSSTLEKTGCFYVTVAAGSAYEFDGYILVDTRSDVLNFTLSASPQPSEGRWQMVGTCAVTDYYYLDRNGNKVYLTAGQSIVSLLGNVTKNRKDSPFTLDYWWREACTNLDDAAEVMLTADSIMASLNPAGDRHDDQVYAKYGVTMREAINANTWLYVGGPMDGLNDSEKIELIRTIKAHAALAETSIQVHDGMAAAFLEVYKTV